jgi:Ca2+-binding RTX toxin-like protein
MATILGTSVSDTLQGTNGADRLVGLQGNDILSGVAGDDQLYGGAGDDFMYGGAGDDSLVGGLGEDFFYGGSGMDAANYATALGPVRLNLVVQAESGGVARGDLFFSIERFRLTSFGDVFLGSAQSDTVFGGNGRDTLRGGLGDDLLMTSGDNGILDGGDGNDTLGGGSVLDGAAGNDTLTSGSGSATLRGGAGDDLLRGRFGDDLLLGGMGRDRMFGGIGNDTASYANAEGAVVVDVARPGQSRGDALGDRFNSIEVLILSGFGDRLLIGALDAAAFGGGGSDTLIGGSSLDTLSGDAGRDWIYGGVERDLLFGGAGFDHLFGGTGDDTVYGGAEVAPDAFPKAFGVAFGGAGNDSVFGGNIRDLLGGDLGADSLFGGAASDTLLGNGGTDKLVGGVGDDVLNGGSGADRIYGGAGIDTVRYGTTVTYHAAIPALHTGDAAGDVLTSVERLAFLGINSIYVGSGSAMTIFASATGLQVRAGSGAETVFDATQTMVVSFGAVTQGVTLTSELTALVGGGAAAGDTFIGAGTFRLTEFRDEVNVAVGFDTNSPSFFLGVGDDHLTLTQPREFGPNALGPLPVFDGGAGDDVITIFSSLAFATVFGGTGNDTLSCDSFYAPSFLYGGAGDDVMTNLGTFEGGGGRSFGGDGNDTITVRGIGPGVSGGAGNDTISATYGIGIVGEDSLEGNDGDDTITIQKEYAGGPDIPDTRTIVVNGGAGNDTITGLAPDEDQFWPTFREHFAFNANWGDDVIFNFGDEWPSGEDKDDFILFENTAAIGLDSFDDLTVTQGAGFTLVTFGTNSIRLEGITATDFTAEDVLFT